jgi:hypothetical protein
MDRYRTYFKWAGGLAIAYAGLLIASWALLASAFGPGLYELATPTGTTLFEVYGSRAAETAMRLEVVAWFVLAATLPAFALYLSRRTPGLAWGGLAVGALALVVSLISYLIEVTAFNLATAPEGEAALLAIVPPSDLILLFNLMAEALAMPMMLATYAWFLIWGLAFYRTAERLPRLAALAFGLTVAFFLFTLAGFATKSALLANGGMFLQTLMQAAAFALGGGALMVGAKTPER